MIGISTKLFDLDGVDVFFDKDIKDLSNKVDRRVSTTATLDGGSYVSDQGYSDSDKQLNFKILNISKVRYENLVRIAKLHSRVYVCMSEGAFECVIKQIYISNAEVSINIIVVGVA